MEDKDREGTFGIKTRKIQGHSEIQLKKSEFDTLLVQYGIIELPTPTETLPNSTTLSSQDIPSTYTGRELVESEGNATNSLPTQDIDNKGLGHLVESGRELQRGSEEENKISEFIDIELICGPLCKFMGTIAGMDLAKGYTCSYPTLTIARKKAEELRKVLPSARAVRGKCKNS